MQSYLVKTCLSNLLSINECHVSTKISPIEFEIPIFVGLQFVVLVGREPHNFEYNAWYFDH